MHIILGKENAADLEDKYTLLELDLIKIDERQPALQAYCVLDDLPADDVLRLEEFTKLHKKLIENYCKQDWNFCEQALDHLKARWGGQIDSFYSEIAQRIAKYKENDPGENWDPAIKKY